MADHPLGEDDKATRLDPVAPISPPAPDAPFPPAPDVPFPPAPTAQPEPYAQPDPYAQQPQYAQPDPYAQQPQYAQPDPYAPGQYYAQPQYGQAVVPGGVAYAPAQFKTKTPAVLLAVFLGFWTWLYTYQRDAWKFWLNLGLTVVTLGFWGLVAWVWAIIDVCVKPESYYTNFPNG